jgi:hypothetical protein
VESFDRRKTRAGPWFAPDLVVPRNVGRFAVIRPGPSDTSRAVPGVTNRHNIACPAVNRKENRPRNLFVPRPGDRRTCSCAIRRSQSGQRRPVMGKSLPGRSRSARPMTAPGLAGRGEADLAGFAAWEKQRRVLFLPCSSIQGLLSPVLFSRLVVLWGNPRPEWYTSHAAARPAPAVS